MLRNKYFWLTLLVGAPFVALWIEFGLTAAVFIVAMLIAAVAMLSGRRSRPDRTEYYVDDYDDEPRDIYIHRRSVRCPRCGGSGTVPSLYIPRSRVRCPDCDGTGRLWD